MCKNLIKEEFNWTGGSYMIGSVYVCSLSVVMKVPVYILNNLGWYDLAFMDLVSYQNTELTNAANWHLAQFLSHYFV